MIIDVKNEGESTNQEELVVTSYNLLFHLFSYFKERFNSTERMEKTFDIREDTRFWGMIKTGLLYSTQNSHIKDLAFSCLAIKKRTSQILKELVDFALSHECVLCPASDEGVMGYPLKSRKHLQQLWSIFFFLWETLDQFALHLLEVWNKGGSLIKMWFKLQL